MSSSTTMKAVLLLAIICIEVTSGLSDRNGMPSRKSHSGRIPSNVKIIYGKPKANTPPTPSGPSLLQILANNLPSDLSAEHKLLYYRTRQKDYDYAQFGKPCRMYTLEELEAFLRIPQDAIEPHEGQRETSSPAQKEQLLETLFNHSRTICDFRNLLTCHKHFRTCACAHSSMGLNREGICGINLGHPCELSERVLAKNNLLLFPESNPVRCLLENAECVLDEGDVLGGSPGPMRKVCRCRKGFWGATCRRRQESSPGGIVRKAGGEKRSYKRTIGAGAGIPVQAPPPLDVSTERVFWNHAKGDLLQDKFMHPEEIKERLVEMMNTKEMYPPEYRDEEAQKLVKNLQLDVDKEEMVVNELHLRLLASLKMGSSCEPERQIILDNPPVAKSGLRWTDPPADDITSWQLGLLENKNPFCNIYDHFRCDEATRVCQCRPGLVLQKGKCVIPLGHNCGVDFDTILEFDPLRDRKRFSEAFPPNCVDKTECKDQPLFFTKKCWCKSSENCTKWFDEHLFSSMISAVKSRFTLNIGDSCDPKMHKELLGFNNDKQNPNHEERMSLFRELIENPETRLCDIELHLNCSDTSRTCECWKQLKPGQKGSCVSINMASCGRTFEYGKYMYPDGSQLWQVEKAFQTKFLPECTPKAVCAGGDDLQWAGRCVCTEGDKSGQDCADKKAVLSSAFQAHHIPSDNEEEMKMIRVFFDLNHQTYLLEQLMTLSNGEVCEPETGLKLERIVKFWREVASSDELISGKRDLGHFVGVTKWTKFLISSVAHSAALCNSTVGLRCFHTTGKCGCAQGSRWIQSKCFLDDGESCDPQPGQWVSKCSPGSQCTLSGGSHHCSRCPTGSECEDETDPEDAFDEEEKEEISVPSKEDSDWIVVKPKGRSIDGRSDEKIDHLNNKYISRPAPEVPPEVHLQVPHEVPPEVPIEFRSRNLEKADEQLLTDHQLVKFTEETDRMLSEIMNLRILDMKDDCNVDEESVLDELLPSLPNTDLSLSPVPVSELYEALSRLFWTGISFCDRVKFLTCDSTGVCGCSPGLGLIEEENECRLLENKFCTVDKRQANHAQLQKHFPELECRKGTECQRLDFGMSICIESDKSPLKHARSRSLESNDDANNSCSLLQSNATYFILASYIFSLFFRNCS